MSIANFVATLNNFWRLDSKYKAKDETGPIPVNPEERSRKWEKKWVTKEFGDHTISVLKWVPLSDRCVTKSKTNHMLLGKKNSRPLRKSLRFENTLTQNGPQSGETIQPTSTNETQDNNPSQGSV